MNENKSLCVWFSKDTKLLSKLLYLPKNTHTTKNIIDNKNEDIVKFTKCCQSYTHDNIPTTIFSKIIPKKITSDYVMDKIKKNKQKAIDKVNNNENITSMKKEIQIKTLNTKYDKKISNSDKVLKSKIIGLEFTESQKRTIFSWFRECDAIYNYCVFFFNTYPHDFNINYMQLKLTIFNYYFKNKERITPYDVLTDEVRIFCSNLKSCFTNLKNGNIKHFTMTNRKKTNLRSILIPSKSITNTGIFATKLGFIFNFHNSIKNMDIKQDCRLVYDYSQKKFYLCIPQYYEKNEPEKREAYCALDPGEKIFQTYFGENTFGKLGEDIRVPILKHETKIRKLQRILSKGVNRKGNKLINKRTIKNRIKKQYRKIKNKVKELHNKSALFLCQNFDTILIPKFETQKMVCDKVYVKNKIKEDINKIKEGDNVKENIRQYTKKRRLNGRVKFVLNNLSHYKFKQHLFYKAEEYGWMIHEVTEEYTSQCCGNCGILSNKYKNREKICDNCDYKINRDINGARNILLKNKDLIFHKNVSKKRRKRE